MYSREAISKLREAISKLSEYFPKGDVIQTYNHLVGWYDLHKSGDSPLEFRDNGTEGFEEATRAFRSSVFGAGFESLISLKKPVKCPNGDRIVGVTNNGYFVAFPNSSKFVIDSSNIIAPESEGSRTHGIGPARVDYLLRCSLLQNQK